MKIALILLVFLLVIYQELPAQRIKKIRDKHITHQQERMVYKQWDKKKFTPTKGFLSLNYQYWLTWGLHPNYPKRDLRPLSMNGPQTQRLLLVAAMNNVNNAYKLQTDTLRNSALTESFNYLGVFSDLDPLWQLYYREEFQPLLDFQPNILLQSKSFKDREYLLRSGTFEWYKNECMRVAERLSSARSANMDRGSRIISYQRLLTEFRKIQSRWETVKQRTPLFLDLSDTNKMLTEHKMDIPDFSQRSDIQIADKVLGKSKL